MSAEYEAAREVCASLDQVDETLTAIFRDQVTARDLLGCAALLFLGQVSPAACQALVENDQHAALAASAWKLAEAMEAERHRRARARRAAREVAGQPPA